MATDIPIDPLIFKTLTAASTTTTLSASLTFCTIINNSDSSLTIAQSGDYAATMSLGKGQGITFQANSHEYLPTLRIVTGTGTTSVSVITN